MCTTEFSLTLSMAVINRRRGYAHLDFTFPQRLRTLPSNTPNLVTGERGGKNTSKRRASHRKQVFNKSKSCRTFSCSWLAPRLRLAVLIGAFRRRKNLSVCVVRVLMPAKTPKGKLRFRRTKGEKKKNLQYPSLRLALFFPKLYSTYAGDSQQEGQGRRQVLIAERLFQVLPGGPGLAAAHLSCQCPARPSRGCHGLNNTYRIVIHECEKSWSGITISVIACDTPTS